MNWLSKLWKSIQLKDVIIVVLILLVFFKGKYKLPDPKIVTVEKIIDHFHDSTIYVNTFHTETIKPTITKIPQVLQPDSNDAVLRKQYNKLLELYASKSVTSDTLKIDTLGYVSVLDTVQFNKLMNRKYSYKINAKERIITTTITQPYKPNNQVYVGGELGWGTGQQNALNSAGIGLMFKNKKDNVLKIGGDYNFTLKSPEIKIGYYTKLHL